MVEFQTSSPLLIISTRVRGRFFGNPTRRLFLELVGVAIGVNRLAVLVGFAELQVKRLAADAAREFLFFHLPPQGTSPHRTNYGE